MAFTFLKFFSLSLPIDARSISVSFSPILYVVFLCSFFLKDVFATHNSFHHKTRVAFFPQHFLPIPYPPCTPSKRPICFPTSPLKSFRSKPLHQGFANSTHLPCHHKINFSHTLIFQPEEHTHIWLL